MSEAARGHEQDPDFTQRFIDAVSSVRNYNDRHIGGMGQASYFLRDVFNSDEDTGVSRNDEAGMEKELVRLLQADDLKAMGIDLVDPARPGLEPLDVREEQEKEEEHPSALFMVIDNADKFADTLHRLKPAPEQKERTAESVDMILAS